MGNDALYLSRSYQCGLLTSEAGHRRLPGETCRSSYSGPQRFHRGHVLGFLIVYFRTNWTSRSKKQRDRFTEWHDEYRNSSVRWT